MITASHIQYSFQINQPPPGLHVTRAGVEPALMIFPNFIPFIGRICFGVYYYIFPASTGCVYQFRHLVKFGLLSLYRSVSSKSFIGQSDTDHLIYTHQSNAFILFQA